MESRLISRRAAAALLLLLATCGCRDKPFHHGKPMERSRFFTPLPAEDPLRGNMVPVHDPALMRAADGTWRIYDTDLPFLHSEHFLEQRCSRDLTEWHGCGYVFADLPAWVRAKYPEVKDLWAPDISYFNGLYHLYYAVSVLGSQHSAIGLATNVTLDERDPRYGWVDQGPVIASKPGGDFNAIDANVFIESGAEPHIWLNYGSYWRGIFQQELDPATGKLLPGARRYHLAEQPTNRNGSVEGASMIAHGGWYYLFASVGYCCLIPIERDNYQQIVGRSRSPHGPFVDEKRNPLLKGAGTVLLTTDPNWLAPGGGSAWQSPDGEQTLLTFHALHQSQNGALYLWIERVLWKEDWPVIRPIN